MQSWLQTGSLRKISLDQEVNNVTTEMAVDHSDHSGIPEVATKRRKVRKYDTGYIKLGFSWTGTEEEPRPVCGMW